MMAAARKAPEQHPCASSLAQYQAAAEGACGAGDTFGIVANRSEPASFIPQILFYNFNRTCIQDEGRWCNVVNRGIAEGGLGAAARAPAAANTTSSANGTVPSPNLLRRQQQAVDLCDNCIIKQVQFQAGSPIYDGFRLQSMYSSLTSSCSKTGFPLVTSTTPLPAGPVPTDPGISCTGNFYNIQPGNTCRSISQSQGVATAWLLYDNGLPAFCADFPTNGSLCIQSKCALYTVKANDTCLSIAKPRGLAQVQLTTWNPILGDLCRSMKNSIGDSICVSPPGEPDYTISPYPTTTGPPVQTVAPVPPNTAPNTTTNCALYHFIAEGEYCNKLVQHLAARLSISEPPCQCQVCCTQMPLSPCPGGLLTLTAPPSCTNLWKDTSYCVKAVGSINQYPGHPDYVTTTAYVTVPYGSLPKATYVPPAITGLPQLLPMANGTRTDCFLYAGGGSLTLPYDISTSWFNSVCEALAGAWSIRLDQLANWNPSLQVNSTSCAPEPGYRYCMAQWDSASFTQPPKPIETHTLLPIREGATPECKAYQSVIAGFTCQGILDQNDITIAQFYAWNPTVGDQCQGLWPGYRYCISITENPDNGEDPSPATTSTTSTSSNSTSSAPNPSPTPPGPTQEGIAANCNKWHLAGDGLFCYDISVLYVITTDQFHDWSPAVSRDCGSGFYGAYAYCVGLSS
ncbi:hypothetical protein RB595_004963 [Gaeumannomyces hyphopodioides]